MMENKTIARTKWTRITSRRMAYMPLALGEARGEAGLLWMDQVSEPFTVTSVGEQVTIVAKNYSWLQLAPIGMHFWATVMFDDTGQLIQYYFDITYQNTICMPGKSGFTDLYLDVVLKPNGDMMLLDEDELDQALRAGDITDETHALARGWAQTLMDALYGNEPILRAYCERTRSALIPHLAPA